MLNGRAKVWSECGGARAAGSEGGGKLVIHDKGGVVKWTVPTVGVCEGIMSFAAFRSSVDSLYEYEAIEVALLSAEAASFERVTKEAEHSSTRLYTSNWAQS